MINSGYSGYSMSNRAVEAYNSGERPLSKWTKKDIISVIGELDPRKAELFSKLSLSALKENVLVCSSWHHTSTYFNRTDFYEVDETYIETITENEILELVDKNKKNKKENTSNAYKGSISYLEWLGSRKHPKAKEVCLENVNIEERGCFYYVTDDTGKELLKKKIGSNGTTVVNYAEEEKKKKEKEEHERKVRELSSKEAMEFYDEIKNDCSYSSSGHIYKKGRKPSPYDYDMGLENFFEIGEHRLRREPTTGIMHLETWNGNCWE